MITNKKLVFSLFLAGFMVFTPFAGASAEEGRYFVKSTRGFWKNALGVRHSFDNGFTTDLSDFQVRFNRILGLEIEPVKVFQILDEKTVTPNETASSNPSADTVSEETAKPSPTLTPKAIVRAKPRTGRPLPSNQTPWGIEVIYNDSTVTRTSGGANVKVAVLDTGVNVNHLDLKSRIAQCKDFTDFRFPIIDGKCEDKNGHGTHVAGIIAANAGADGKGIYGVAPEAKLLIYKVCGANGSCYSDDIAAALRLAADQGANILNMSFGSDSESQLIHDAIAYATAHDVLPVAAAGNDGPFEASIDYPGANPAVIAVGALNQFLLVTEWSSRGVNASNSAYIVEEKDIEFAVPGENIESTWNNGGYAILSGTSMASPFVAGLAAKFWQSSAASTRSYLHSLAQDLLPIGDDNYSGFGLPIVTVPPTPTPTPTP